MARYRVPHRYSSESNGVTYGPWEEGQEVELDDAQAAWLIRDGLSLESLEEAPDPSSPEPDPDADGEPAADAEDAADPEPEPEPQPKPRSRGRGKS